MMHRPPTSRSRLGVVLAVATMVAVAAAWGAGGGAMFSPGALHAADSTPVARKGVRSHAELGRQCGACHEAPWSRDRMDERCLECHDDIQQAMRDTANTHGRVRDVTACVSCHSEHQGADASAFQPGRLGPLHEALDFALTGGHRRVACDQCHKGAKDRAGYAKAPRTCIGCHREDDRHRGQYGENCASCHSTRRWGDTNFAHQIFPVDHGAKGRGKCGSCHENPADYKQYTCYTCHEHSREKVAEEHRGMRGQNIEDCVQCHRGGALNFAHRVFPLNHGGEGRIACKTCHENPDNYKQYTCYNCHEHSRARVEREHRGEVRAQNLDDCVRCHRGGGDGEHGEGGERRRRERD